MPLLWPDVRKILRVIKPLHAAAEDDVFLNTAGLNVKFIAVQRSRRTIRRGSSSTGIAASPIDERTASGSSSPRTMSPRSDGVVSCSGARYGCFNARVLSRRANISRCADAYRTSTTAAPGRDVCLLGRRLHVERAGHAPAHCHSAP